MVTAPDRGRVSLDVRGGALVRTYGVISVEPGGELVSQPPLEAPNDEYELRAWRPGDRMRPARLKGRSRKLSDLFIDAKVPRKARGSARVLVRRRDATIVWAEHLGAAFGEPCFRDVSFAAFAHPISR
jgi:tRNA(Ile)-lysidine synthetase-like protein